MTKENKSSDIILYLTILAVIGIALEPVVNKILNDLKSIDWILVTIIVAVILLSLLTFFLLIYHILKNRKQTRELKQEKEKILEKQKKELEKKLKTTFGWDNSYSSKKKLTRIKVFIDSLPKEITSKHKDAIKKFYREAKKVIHEKELEEKQKILELQNQRKEEEREKRRYQRQVNELLKFKKEKNSIKALPINKKYSREVINEAEYRMKGYVEKETAKKETRNGAIKYYKIHNLDTKPDLSPELDKIYAEVRKEIEEGELDVKKISVDNMGQPLEKNFYRAREMDEDIKNKAIAQGFQHVRSIELDGKICGGGFYIKKIMESESDYHFYSKHLFAELQPNMKIEHSIDGKRVDIAFISKGLKLGIEIETGTNKIKQLAAKIPWLNKNFDKWIFVCSRKLQPKYNKLVDHEKSFCLSPKKAKEKVLQLCHSYKS